MGLYKYNNMKGILQEIKIISWPTLDYTWKATLLVLAVIIFFTTYITGLDLIFIEIRSLLVSLVK